MKITTDEATTLELISGDGGDTALDAETLQFLKQRASEAARRTRESLQSNVDVSEARHCEWEYQTADGLVNADTDGVEANPFDGASDQRVRWCDALVNEDVLMCMVALSQAQIQCTPRGGSTPDTARRQTLLLRHLKDSLRSNWWIQFWRLANYVTATEPALGAMRVGWKIQRRMEYQTLDTAGLAKLYVAQMTQRYMAAGVSAEVAAQEAQAKTQEFALLFMNPATPDDELSGLLMQYFPGITQSRARKVIRQIRKDGQAEFPTEIAPWEGPEIRAMEYGVDFAFDDNCTDWNRCRAWFEPVWMSRAELQAAVDTDGWNEAFVQAVLEHEAQPAFGEQQKVIATDDTQSHATRYRGLYQVLWCHYWATNEDGVNCRMEAVIHMGVDADGQDRPLTAFGRRMQRSAHGQWDAHLIVREVLDRFLTNSRSITALASPMQGPAKVLMDAATNNGIMGAEPPVISHGYANKGNLAVEPWGHIATRAGGDVKWMQPPSFPATTTQMLDRLIAMRDEYFLRGGDHVPPDLVRAKKQWQVFWWLQNAKEILRMMLADARKYASETYLMQVTDDRGATAIRSRAELEGEFDVEVSFNPADLDSEHVTAVMDTMAKVLPVLDRNQTVDTTPIVQQMVSALMPYVPSGTFKAKIQAEADELREEFNNYMVIRGGGLPQMNTDGRWNYQIRRDMYKQMEQANPNVFLDMGPDKQKNLFQWWQALEQQITQFGVNQEVGRTGLKDTAGMSVAQGTGPA